MQCLSRSGQDDVIAGEVTPGTEDPRGFAERPLPLEGVVQHDETDDGVEAPVREGEPGGVGLADLDSVAEGASRREAASTMAGSTSVAVRRIDGNLARSSSAMAPEPDPSSSTSPRRSTPSSAQGKIIRRVNHRHRRLRQNACSTADMAGIADLLR